MYLGTFLCDEIFEVPPNLYDAKKFQDISCKFSSNLFMKQYVAK